MRTAGSPIRLATDPWIGFFALVLAAWGGLFVAATGLAGHVGAGALGPGMAWMAPHLHAFAVHAPLHAAGLHDALAIAVAMWALMSVAMMAPTAVPMLRAYRHLVEGSAGRAPRGGFRALLAGSPSHNDGRRRLVGPKKIIGEVEPVEGAVVDEPVMVSNAGYWMGPDIVIARATESRVRAFGRVWDLTGRSAEICATEWAGP